MTRPLIGGVTPDENEEFDEQGRAVAPEARNRVDLLSVVMHELGHLLGLEHDDDPDSLMYDLLAPGVRRRVTTADVDSLFATRGWE